MTVRSAGTFCAATTPPAANIDTAAAITAALERVCARPRCLMGMAPLEDQRHGRWLARPYNRKGPLGAMAESVARVSCPNSPMDFVRPRCQSHVQPERNLKHGRQPDPRTRLF